VKQKDVLYLLLAVVILLVAGYVGYNQIVPKKASSNTVEVEKIGPIPSELDSAALVRLSDASKVKEFSLPVDLSNLNNRAIFGQ
jgi:spore coat protein CotH